MYKERKKLRRIPDLTRTKSGEKSVGAQLEPLIKNLNKYSLEQMKTELIKILDAPETSISKIKANEYKTYMHKIYKINMMQIFISNIYLASANMSMKKLNSKI
jgi:hypothetical protein